MKDEWTMKEKDLVFFADPQERKAECYSTFSSAEFDSNQVNINPLKFNLMRKILVFLAMLLFTAFCFNANAQWGENDTTFNSTDLGFDNGEGASSVYTTAIQSDEKIIIGGNFLSYNGTARNYIARLNTDGTLDTTFNIGTGASSWVVTTAIQNDGKIIIGGYFTSYNGTVINHIARLNADGTLDTTFNIGTGANNTVETTAIQSDGKIIIGGGFTSYNGTARNHIARLNTDGTLDTTFNPGTGASSYVRTSTIQSDGKIIIGGWFTSYNGTARKNIARLNADGTLDLTFNVGTGANDDVFTSAIQNDGKIIIGGEFTSYNGTAINRIARLNTDGTLDMTFNIGTGASNYIRTSTIQSDGKIIIGGVFTSYNGTAINRIARLNTDGTLDSAFKPTGTGVNNMVRTTAIQNNGKIILGGYFTAYNKTAIIGIARLDTDGTLDTTFNIGTGASYYVSTTAIQSDGKIIIGGGFKSYNGTLRNYIARLNTDGTLDTTFNIGTGASSTIITTTIQSDGKIIIGGYFTSFNGTAINHIARLNPDGTLDGTFNPGTGANNTIRTTAIQSDGKIIIGGDFTTFNGTARNSIARLNTDGTLDGTFNPGTGANSYVSTTAIQSDGKIIIGGAFTSYNGTGINRIARLDTNGTLDPTFNIGTGTNDNIFTSAIQSNGKIIIGGYFFLYNGTAKGNIARLNTDGTLDGTFNPGIGSNSTVRTSAIQNDGKVIIGGNFTAYDGTSRNYIARLNADGTLDMAFNPGTGASNWLTTTAIQSDGKIIIGGWFTSYNGTGRNRVARILNCTNNTTATETVTACDSLTWYGTTYTTSGMPTHIIPNAAGCDSTITLNLTIKNSTSSTDVQIACDSYLWIDGNTYTANNNVATHIIPNAAGCDSTITLDLTIKNSTSSTDVQTACDSYLWIDGNTYTANNNVATHIIPNTAGCDSTITLDLTIKNSTSSTDVQTACDSYLWIDGNTYTANNNLATHIIPNAAGCDSTITLDLTINTVDVSIVVTDPTITANASGATYQWVDCDNGYLPISGEINQSFTAIVNGNYAVIVTQGLCSDTSVCTLITSIGISPIQTEVLSIYPNPVTNELIIEIKGSKEKTNFVILNLMGQVVYKDNFIEKTTVQTSTFIPGVYLVKLENGKSFEFKKIIKE